MILSHRASARLAPLFAIFAISAAGCSTARLEPCHVTPVDRAPKNFGQVLTPAGEPSGLYRGAQPKSCDELRYLRSIGIVSILKLNDRGLPEDESEMQQAKDLGLEILSIPFNSLTIGRPSSCPSVRRALDFISDPRNQPVYVHCTAGKDRTGYIVGMFERTVLHESVDEVLDHLHDYGHTGIRSIVMGQIDHELERDQPACAP